MKKLYPLLSVLFLIYWGCEEASEQLENEESKKSTLYNYTILDSAVQIKWSANNDVDFFSYKILRNGISIYETDNRVDTTHITSFENTYTFTIATKFLDSDTVHSNSILKHNLFYKVYVGHLGPISGNISVDDEYITSNGNDVNIFDSNGNHQWSDVIGVGAEYLNLYAEPYAISVTNNYYSASGINGWRFLERGCRGALPRREFYL